MVDNTRESPAGDFLPERSSLDRPVEQPDGCDFDQSETSSRHQAADLGETAAYRRRPDPETAAGSSADDATTEPALLDETPTSSPPDERREVGSEPDDTETSRHEAEETECREGSETDGSSVFAVGGIGRSKRGSAAANVSVGETKPGDGGAPTHDQKPEDPRRQVERFHQARFEEVVESNRGQESSEPTEEGRSPNPAPHASLATINIITGKEDDQHSNDAPNDRDRSRRAGRHDLTTELPPRPRQLPALGLAEHRGGMLRQLRDQHTIITYCWHHQFALAAAYSLVEDASLGHLDRRSLNFQGDNQDGSISADDLAWDDQCANSVVLVDVSSQAFFGSLCCGDMHTGTLEMWLAERQTYLVCAVEAPIYHAHPKRDSFLRFPGKALPFLFHLLADQFDPDEARELETTITRQFRRGLWGRRDHESDLYQRLRACLEIGPREVLETIKSLESDRQPAAPVPSNERSTRQQTTLLADDPVASIVQYVAVYFTELTVRDFDTVVRTLLGEDQTQVDEPDGLVSNIKGAFQSKKPAVRYLREIWEQQSEYILDRCQIRSVTRDTGTRVLDFASSTLRQKLAASMESRHAVFLQRQFDRIRASSLLFSTDASRDLRRNLVALYVERVISDPHHHGADWLFELVDRERRAIAREQQEALSELRSSSRSEPESSIPLRPEARRILLRARSARHQLHDRMCDLVQDLSRHPVLASTLREFLDRLVEDRSACEESADLIVRITIRLRSIRTSELRPEPFWWLERLINEGPREARDRAYKGLHSLAKAERRRIHGFLAELRAWLPADGCPVERYRPSNVHAFQFFFEFCLWTLHDVPEDDFGKWPSSYLFFSALSNSETAGAQVAELAFWLGHPGLASIFKVDPEDDGSDSRESRDDARAGFLVFVLGQWQMILEGNNPKSAHPEATAITHALLLELSKSLDRSLLRRIYQKLESTKTLLSDLTADIPAGARTIRHELRQRRAHVMALRRHLKHLERTTRSLERGTR